MDMATHFPHRARADSYRDMEGNMMPEDSGGESESNMIRRKFQRTNTEPDTSNAPAFRKPSLPASATRAMLDRAPSLTNRRKSALRENMRIPSGPREYPSSPGRQRIGSTTSNAPPLTDQAPANARVNGNGSTVPTSRGFLPSLNSDSFFATTSSFGNRRFGLNESSENLSTTTSVPTTPSRLKPPAPLGDDLDFLPDINFDDFQTSIKAYDGNTPLLSDFPEVPGARALPREDYGSTSRVTTLQREEQPKKEGLGRTQSLRQRLASGRKGSGTQVAEPKEVSAPPTTHTLAALRDRRQSSITQTPTTTTVPAPATSAVRPPRKSVGPGVLTSTVKGSATAQQSTDATVKPSLLRNSSLSKARRTTLQPSASAGAELPRMSTLTATTQSRQNKVKCLQPRSSGAQDNPDTPSTKKSRESRAHTPSSSGGKRQSMASGRASGLGARTISPTDARRLKRMSMAQPPLPVSLPKSHTPTPHEEIPNPLHDETKMPELPRFAQPSPSLIPRKTSSATPSSVRGSPEGRQFPSGGMSLSSKSSYQSLLSSGLNGSSSRLPTPKPRSANQSGSSMGQYSDPSADFDPEELVPPVPAIPKGYGSPRDVDQPPFFSTSLKSSLSGYSDAALDTAVLPTPRFMPTPRTSLDVPAETPRKRSGEQSRPVHLRASTLSNGTTPGVSTLNGHAASARAQPDPNGRKNSNLQPLRLPPLNLQPITGTRTLHSSTNHPRPSQEVDNREDWMSFATPEPKRNTKTPSTPMTASKATFFSRRQEEAGKALRSSSSHYALRDVMAFDADGNVTKFWDDSDVEAAGMPMPIAKQRNAITPFASGSLPKSSGEFARNGLRGRPSGEYGVSGGEDDYALTPHENVIIQNVKPRTRAQTNATMNSVKSGLSLETTATAQEYIDSPTESVKKEESEKKESVGGGLRRKLSLGWKRSGSKAANHQENKSSPPQEGRSSEDKARTRLQKRAAAANEMPPPKLPASATWTGEVPSLPTSSRPSMDAGNGSQSYHVRRKSQAPTQPSTLNTTENSNGNATPQQPPPPYSGNGAAMKTRSQHAEQPTPVTSRANSWGNLGQTLRPGAKPAPPGTRLRNSSSNISANSKDKDDLAADEEMTRLSRKRKDVDSAARESEELKKRAIARAPMTAEAVLHDRSLIGGASLNVFERGEIVDYEQHGIYFTGTKSARKVIGSLTPTTPQSAVSSDGKTNGAGGSNNFGYDDERGDYNIVLGDHLAYRYEVVDVLGKGSFGQVVRCVDHKEGSVVAVKIIRNKKRFHQQALVEVGILGKLREWDPDGSYATLSITSSFYFRSHLCIVTPCLSINLYELIRAHNFVGFPLTMIRRFARQLLACLTLLQTKRIIHCDLKPENILLCEARKADVRVIDFGSSCREEEKVYTYIQSRFYRSPEVILGSSYGLGIDMWSLGCILAELWTGYPIFPGENEQEQLACIMEIFGPPDRHLVERCTRKKLFFDSVGKPRVTVSSKGRRRRPSSKTLQQALKTDDDAFVDFIARCLRWDPDRRMKPNEAVTHPFITNQPFNQRPGIPDEARRAPRVRSYAATPAVSSTTNLHGVPVSPVKRTGGNTLPQAATATPARDRARAMPETPQTALRNPTGAAAPTSAVQGSPIKPSPNRRHSAVATAGAAAVAGSKRASNGVVLGSGPGSALYGQNAGRVGSGNLAQMAASASMGASAASGGGGGSRWRA